MKTQEEACNYLIRRRGEIREKFIEGWISFNIPTEEINPELFSKLVLFEQTIQKGTTITVKYWMEYKKDDECQN